MRTIFKKTGGQIKLFAILIAIVFPFGVSADYSAFQNLWEVPPTASSPDYVQQGFSAGRVDMQYIATTTVTQFDRVDVALCRSGGSNIGNVKLEVRYSSTSSTVLASSTLAVTSGNIWASTGCGTGTGFATSSTFVLNAPIQWVSGVTVWLSWTLQGTDPASNFLFSFVDEAISASENGSYRAYFNNVLFETPSPNRSMRIIGRGLGTAPTVSSMYSTTSSVVVCSTFDVGCYLSTSLTFLFYPQETLTSTLTEMASTTTGVVPFGYVPDIYDLIEDASLNATTSLAISVELSGIMNFLGGNFPTTTVTVLSGNGLRTTMGVSMWNFLQTLLIGLFWTGFALYVYRRSIHLL